MHLAANYVLLGKVFPLVGCFLIITREQVKKDCCLWIEQCHNLLNYSTCIRADAELLSDGTALPRWVVLVCVCPAYVRVSMHVCSHYLLK